MSAGGDKERSGAGRDDYETPPWLIRLLMYEFDFKVDAAANASNHLFPGWMGPGSPFPDALKWRWGAGGAYWCNPPFSRIAEFVNHICEQDATVVLCTALAPDRTWYRRAWRYALETRQLTHRVQFLINGKRPRDANGKVSGNTIGSTVFVFRRGAPQAGRGHIYPWDARADAKRWGIL